MRVARWRVVVVGALAACHGGHAAPAMKFAPAAPATAADPARLEKARALAPELDTIFADDLANNNNPGEAVAIVLDGEPVYVKGFGYRDLATKAPFDADTRFPIASITKSFAAMAALRLRDEGRLDLDAPASTYYPPLADLVYPTRDSSPITMRQLLTHGSGLPEDNYWADVQIDMSDADLRALLRSGMTFSRAPATHFEYSNVGFAIAGKVIEKVSGMPAREYIRTKILAPIGMSDSVWTRAEAPAGTVAVGYWGADGYKGEDTAKLPAPAKEPIVFDVAGGLYSTPRDMARYMAYHLSAWPPRDDAETGPVKRSTLREMHQGTRSGNPQEFALTEREPVPFAEAGGRFQLRTFNYGNGFFTHSTCGEELVIDHSGGLPGYSSYMLMIPARGFGIMMFVNDSRGGFGAMQAAVNRFRAAGLLDKRREAAAPELVAAQAAVDALLAAWNDAAATKLFEPTWFVYQTVDTMGAQFASLAIDHGHCQPAEPLDVVNRTRARWRVTCERGSIRFAAALSPRGTPRLQYLLWQSVMPASADMRTAATGILALSAHWDDAAAAKLFADTPDRDAAARLALDGGACTLGEALDGDGTNVSVFALTCAKQPLELQVVLGADHRVAQWRAHPARAADEPFCAR